jgi:hypothetical protein
MAAKGVKAGREPEPVKKSKAVKAAKDVSGPEVDDRLAPFKPKLKAGASGDDMVALMREYLRDLADRDRAVIAGPFTTEVGFELLYWIPLLRWAVEAEPRLAERLTVVSRGGSFSWYEGLFAAYVDAFAVSDPREFTTRRSSQKQREFTDYERELCQRAAGRLELSDYEVLHPALLFNAYYRSLKIDPDIYVRPVAQDRSPAPQGFASRFEQIAAPRVPEAEKDLPDDFVAVRFYFRDSFPDTPQNRRFVSETVEKLTEHTEVVLLNTGIELDEHIDWIDLDNKRLHRIDDRLRPADNLHIQTAVLGRSRAFIGTYGGLAYLAPFMGLPSIGFSSIPDHTQPWHLELAKTAFDRDGWGTIVELENEDLPLLDLMLPELERPRQADSVQTKA